MTKVTKEAFDLLVDQIEEYTIEESETFGASLKSYYSPLIQGKRFAQTTRVIDGMTFFMVDFLQHERLLKIQQQ